MKLMSVRLNDNDGAALAKTWFEYPKVYIADFLDWPLRNKGNYRWINALWLDHCLSIFVRRIDPTPPSGLFIELVKDRLSKDQFGRASNKAP
jgi:hypothetical protein